MRKIICIGHQKTGTTSIGSALVYLGYKVGNPHLRIRSEMKWRAPNHREQLKNITLGVLAKNDAIEDTPCAHFHKELDAAFPGSKFILTRRDTDNWIRSFTNFFNNKFNPIQKWMYGVDQLKGNEEAVRRVYEAKNQEMIDYFKDRPDDLLIVDLEKGDGWLKLVTFLGDDFLKPFPHANKARTGWHSNTNRKRRKLAVQYFYVITVIVLLIIWAYQ